MEENRSGISRDELLRRLASGSPAISLAPAGDNVIYINPQTLVLGQEKIVVERIRAVLLDAS